MKIWRYFRFCYLLCQFKLSRQMMYSFNFWAVLFVDLSVFLIQIAVFSAIFLQVDQINGWNKYQMVFFVGTFTIIDSLYMGTYFFGVIDIPEKVRTGKFDLYLTKPVNPLFLVSFEGIDLGSFLLLGPGIMMLAYSIGKLEIELNFTNLTGYLALIIMMLILVYDFMVIIRSAAFWFTSINSLQEFENEMVNFSFRVPGAVFKGLSKLVLYIILPYGLIATIPTQFMTGVLEPGGWVLTLAVVGTFTLLCQWIWKKGLERYGSASS